MTYNPLGGLTAVVIVMVTAQIDSGVELGWPISLDVMETREQDFFQYSHIPLPSMFVCATF